MVKAGFLVRVPRIFAQ